MSTSFCDAKGREKPAEVEVARFGSRAWRAARHSTRRPDAPSDRAIDASIAGRASLEAPRGQRRRGAETNAGRRLSRTSRRCRQFVKRQAGRKRAAGNALDSAVTPAAARAEVEASSQPMVREGWRLDSSRRSGEVRARVRLRTQFEINSRKDLRKLKLCPFARRSGFSRTGKSRGKRAVERCDWSSCFQRAIMIMSRIKLTLKRRLVYLLIKLKRRLRPFSRVKATENGAR